MKKLQVKLTDAEIRLIILSAYYHALKKGKNVSQGKIPRLEHLKPEDLNWHFIWLIEHRYLRGTVEQVTAGSIPFVSRIDVKGIDFIEKISEEETRNPKSEFYSKVVSTPKGEKPSMVAEFILEGVKLTNNALSLVNKLSGS